MLGAAVIDEAAAFQASIASAHDHEADSRPSEVPSSLVLRERGVELHRAEWRQLAERAREMGGVDALIVDAPYSERTHAGHDTQSASLNGSIVKANGVRDTARERRAIDYAAWTAADVDAFVAVWAPLVRNWFVSITDEDLRGAWRAAMDRAGLLTFARVPAVETGATVRFNGDGSPNWTTDIVRGVRVSDSLDVCDVVTARTRSPRHQGAWQPEPFYVVKREYKPVVGGKPVDLLRRIVRDYTRPGDLVCDPCAGAGTLGVACIAEGRRALLGDRDAAHVEIARKRLLSCPGEQRRLTLDVDAKPMTQASLLETGS